MSVNQKHFFALLLLFLLCLSPFSVSQAASPWKSTPAKQTSSLRNMKKISAAKQAKQKKITLKALKKAQKKLRKTSVSLSRILRARAKAEQKAADQSDMNRLNQKISSYFVSNGINGSQWSVYVKNLVTNCSTIYNHRTFYAASTIKLFAMSGAYQKIHDGQLSMTAGLQNKLYNMIVYSDNDSFNSIILDYLGQGYVNSHVQKLSLPHTVQNNSLSPGSHPYISYPKGSSNTTCAEDCGLLLEKIYRGTLVSKGASSEMANLLRQQNNRSKIPAGIPSGVPVGNKTGETDSCQHDTAIVYADQTPYIICIFSENAPGSYGHIRNLSSLVYHYLNA